MSRLMKRLKGFQRSPYQQSNLPNNEYFEDDEYFPEYETEEAGGYPSEYQQQIQSELAQQYDALQKKITEYEREMKAIEVSNPHSLFKDIVNQPTPKGTYKVRVFGRPVDLASLENYLIYKISPKTVTTLMRYNDARSIEDVKGYSKRPRIRLGKSGLIWIILGAAVLLILGLIFLSSGPNMTEMMRGMFGMG